MTVRDASPVDRAAIRRVHEEAFGRPGEATLAEALEPVVSLVAIDGDKGVVGHVLLAEASLDGVHPILTLGPLGVRPAAQGRGAGSGLVQVAIERSRATAFPAIVLVGDPAFYGRLGFAAAAPMGIASPFEDVAAEAWQALQLPAWAPDVNGTVVYPSPWEGV